MQSLGGGKDEKVEQKGLFGQQKDYVGQYNEDTCHYISVQTRRTYTTRVTPTVNRGLRR